MQRGSRNSLPLECAADCNDGMDVTQFGSLANIADVKLDEKRCSWAIRCYMPDVRGWIGGGADMGVGRVVGHFRPRVASRRTKVITSRSSVFHGALVVLVDRCRPSAR